MKTKLLITTGIILLFSACSEKSYKDLYTNQVNIFHGRISTLSENNNNSTINGENPMKRPSYDEYREQ